MPTYSDLKAAQGARSRSLRARAREHYAAGSTRPRARRDAKIVPLKIPTALTLKVRALYEDSIVPVRELARLAGVTERTLYKYVRRGGWRRRHPRAVLFRGAGGHFVSREEAAQPQACGLGALDPAAAARRLDACRGAARRASRIASETLACERLLCEFETRVRTLGLLAQAWRALDAHLTRP